MPLSWFYRILVFLIWYIHMIAQVLLESRPWDQPTPDTVRCVLDPVTGSFRLFSSPKVADLVQFGAIPDGKRNDVCSKVHEVDCIQSVLWAIERTPFTYTLVRIASAPHLLSSRTDGDGVDVIQRPTVIRQVTNAPSRHIYRQPSRPPGHARLRSGPQVYSGGRSRRIPSMTLGR